jgi:enoyl-CoA hydratase/carnithine racemase
MPWTIERQRLHVAVVTMNTNKINAQNPAFFADLHAAFDRLETEFNDCAVVLTGSGAVFTAGLLLPARRTCAFRPILCPSHPLDQRPVSSRASSVASSASRQDGARCSGTICHRALSQYYAS